MKNKTNKGAFDNVGAWWHENDIKAFTNGSVLQFFGKKKDEIEIIDRPK